jgi:hypothetical protein
MNWVIGAVDNSRIVEELCEVKVSCTVLKERAAGRLVARLSPLPEPSHHNGRSPRPPQGRRAAKEGRSPLHEHHLRKARGNRKAFVWQPLRSLGVLWVDGGRAIASIYSPNVMILRQIQDGLLDIPFSGIALQNETVYAKLWHSNTPQ